MATVDRLDKIAEQWCAEHNVEFNATDLLAFDEVNRHIHYRLSFLINDDDTSEDEDEDSEYQVADAQYAELKLLFIKAIADTTLTIGALAEPYVFETSLGLDDETGKDRWDFTYTLYF